MPLKADRPFLVVGSPLAYRHYYRELMLMPGARPHENITSAEKLRGRRFIWDDIIWLWDAGKLRDFDTLYRYARYVSSMHDSRDSDESGTVRGRGEGPPHTD